MKYFLDTEFIEHPHTIDLISLALVAEDGRELYVVSNQYDKSNASKWIKTNVIAKLSPDTPRKSRTEIRDMVLGFTTGDSAPEFWGYYADYDWVVFCWLFGSMIDLPKGFPMYCRDLKQELDRRDVRVPFKNDNEHTAIADARWTKKAYEWLCGKKK